MIFFLFDLVFFALDRWRKKAPSFWGRQREEHIPLCPLPTALSSPETRTRRQPGQGRQEPGEERSSPSTVEKQNCGAGAGGRKGTRANNARPPRSVSLSAEKEVMHPRNWERRKTQPRTKDSPLGLDVQPLQSFRAELVPPPELTLL
ncbi:hypothetical protein Nmel_016935 [Mimus melanotis]